MAVETGAARIWSERTKPFDEWNAAVARGDFAKADALVAESQSPLAAEAREITRRLRFEWCLDRPAMLRKLKAELPGEPPAALEADLDRWTASGAILSRTIDGQTFYFRREPRALFLSNDDARDRRLKAGRPADNSDRRLRTPGVVADMIEALTAAAPDASALQPVLPVRTTVDFTVTVQPGARNFRAGAKVRAWLPFPKAYHQQTNPVLLSSSPAPTALAPEDAPQRTIYFEQTITDAAQPLTFKYSAQYDTAALVSPSPGATSQATFNDAPTPADTAERPPHIRFSPRIREIVAGQSKDRPDPATLAQRLWSYVDDYAPWTPEQEYGLIPAIPDQVLAAHRGDCGAVSLTFITLCRSAGIPARWVTGWSTEPGTGGMHDWAEVYLPHRGWVPVDTSYGKKTPPPNTPEPLASRIRNFYFGSLDHYRFIVNSDFGRAFSAPCPPFPALRADTVDLQRGEILIDGQPLWFDEFDYDAAFKVERR